MAIREQTVYIHGTPDLPQSSHRVYLDIEGHPNRDFCYLIGALLVSDGVEAFHSFWADAESDEADIFLEFANLVSPLPDFRVFHFGDYDAAAIRRVAAGSAGDRQRLLDEILQRTTNILPVLYPHVYFPTYSNSLKEIGGHLRCVWPVLGSTGLESIEWRSNWETRRLPEAKMKLAEYNKADCEALRKLTEFIAVQASSSALCEEPKIKVSKTTDIQFPRPHWQIFAPKPFAVEDLHYVSKCAYFDYQRDKVYVRTHPQFKSINKHARMSVKRSLKPNKTVHLEAQRCLICRSRKLERSRESAHDVVDLHFSRSGVRKVVIRIISWRYRCAKCGNEFRSEERLGMPQKYGHGLASWCVYQNSVCGVNMNRLRKSFADLFDLYLGESTVQIVKQRLSVFYEPLYQELLQETIRKAVIHIDETTVRMRKVNGYVWVLTSMDMVYYFYKPSREAAFLRELLNPFNGVLVSDFYAGYDALPCQQQKCLVHLVRDIDDDLLRNPLDEELKLLARSFGSLLRTIIATVDLFGLKRRHLNKHRKDVGRFLKTVETTSYSSALAKAYAKRFEKHGPKMFTFLNHDGVPWNNNNAEHAIKRFVKFRRETDGRYTESTLKQYLILASVLETCEFNNVNPLKFLLSKENTLGGLLRMAGRKIKNTVSSSAPATVESANQDEQCRER